MTPRDMIRQTGDADMTDRAKQVGRRMVSPPQTARCPHGRVYSYRWEWAIGSTIEDSEPRTLKHGCSRCNPDDEWGDR